MRARHDPLSRGRRRAAARTRAAPGAMRSPTCSSCSSTLPSSPAAVAHSRRSCTLGEDFYRARGVDVVETNRGGRITYHGPGQLVGYPIMRIDEHPPAPAQDRSRRSSPLSPATASAHARAVPRGPTTPACGSRIARSPRSASTSPRGVTTHGFAVNLDNDLAPFSWVIACGLPGAQMTSARAAS